MSAEPPAFKVFKRLIVGLILLLLLAVGALVLLDLPEPRFHIGSRRVGLGGMLVLGILLAIPVTGLLLVYEIARSVAGSLGRRRNVAANDQAFLHRVASRSRKNESGNPRNGDPHG